MFHRLAGDDNEIDAEELQDVLTASLRKGMDSSSYLSTLILSPFTDKLVSVFDIGACRLMIAMLDVSSLCF